MTIERVKIKIKGHENPLSFGLRITGSKNFSKIHLFTISDNSGPALYEHLWTVKDHITKMLNQSNRKKFWFLTDGRSTTSLDFQYFKGKPLRLDVSNGEVLRPTKTTPWTSEAYNASYKTPINIREHFKKATKHPHSVFCFESKSAFSTGGIFPCVPSYFNDPKSEKDFAFYLADINKLITALKETDVRNETRLSELQRNFARRLEVKLAPHTIANPFNTGSLGVNKDGTIDLRAGSLELVATAHSLKLPFIPMAVSLHMEFSDRSKIKALIGYDRPGLETATEQLTDLTRVANIATDFMPR